MRESDSISHEIAKSNAEVVPEIDKSLNYVCYVIGKGLSIRLTFIFGLNSILESNKNFFKNAV
jgi:hypothetical protein